MCTDGCTDCDDCRRKVAEVIRRVKGGFKLFSRKTGRPLSRAPKSEEAARKQEEAIEIAKKRAKLHGMTRARG